MKKCRVGGAYVGDFYYLCGKEMIERGGDRAPLFAFIPYYPTRRVMIDKSYIEGIASQYCATEHPDYYIVEVAVHPGNRIIVELGARGGISIDACVALSKHIEGQLDREAEDFELEVGSAGLTAPFKVLRQYTDAIGEEVEVLRKGGHQGEGRPL